MQVFIFITNTDFDPPKRLIIFSHENKSQQDQLSTASVFIQQIPTNFQRDSEDSITTPLSVKSFRNRTFQIEDPESAPLKSYLNIPNGASFLANRNIYPNHRYDVRRQVTSEYIDQPRPFEYIIRGTPPSAFQRAHSFQLNSSSVPQIPKEYVGTVNSIQDILRQVSDNGNEHQDSNGMHKIKIAGTYKHRKVDDITSMFESAPRKNRGQTIDVPVIQPHSVDSNKVIRDPFYHYKPNSMSDVNLMATNQFRFAPTPYNILSNKYIPMGQPQTHVMDPSNLYQQIIVANQNRLKYSDGNSKNDNIQSKQKPFTLMLDVYPMPEDERISSTSSLPVKYQNHFNPNRLRHPGVSTINNLQPFYHNANYPQGSRYPNLPHYHNPNYFRKFGTKPLNSGLYSNSNDRESAGNNPSQITVHLNLFPKKKDHHNQNVDILNKNDPTSEKDESNSMNIRLQERMAKLGVKANETQNENELGKVTNKVDVEAFQSTTVSNVKQNVIMIDDGDNFDSSEDIFSEEFLQFHSTDSPTEFSSDVTPFELKSVDSALLNLVPTILPIEPRGHSRQS